MDQAVKVPLSERINFRLVAFIAVIALLVGYPVYVMVDQQVSGAVSAARGKRHVSGVNAGEGCGSENAGSPTS